MAGELEEGGRATPGSLTFKKKTQVVDLEWKNVNLKVPIKQKGRKDTVLKPVLQDVSGRLQVGSLTAIMGPSGGGKTSLLNTLAGRVLHIKGAQLTGELLVNNQLRVERSFKRASAYVTQDDFLYAFLTVHETLSMAASFSLGGGRYSREEREAQVEAVLTELGLAKVRDTIVGSERVRGVSGGERKRVSIGVELISDPSILFLDEPTSGLDSFQALSVMSALKVLASHGRTVAAAIHQPRSSIYALFDDLYLVSEGRTIYSGSAAEAEAYFAAQGFRCPGSYNPSDFYLDVVSMDYRSKELEDGTRARIQKLADAWADRHHQQQHAQEQQGGPAQSQLQRPIKVTRDSLVPLPQAPAPAPIPKDSNEAEVRVACCGAGGNYNSSWWTQFRLLTWRSLKIVMRNWIALAIRIVMGVFFGLIMSAIFSDIRNDQKGIQDRQGVLFFTAMNQVFGSVIGVVQAFPLEKPILQRERASRSYRISAYYLAKTLAETPGNILFTPVIFSCISYFSVKLNPEPARFFFFVLTAVVEAFCGSSLGLLISATAPSPEAAQAMGPPFTVVFLLFAGFYINIDNLGTGAKWVPKISLVKWAFQSFCINEFEGATFDCTDAKGSCIGTGEEVLDRLSFGGTSKWTCIMALFVLAAGFQLLAFLTIAFNTTKYMTVSAEGASQKATVKSIVTPERPPRGRAGAEDVDDRTAIGSPESTN